MKRIRDKKNIEVEIRSFISEEQYNALFEYFRKESKYLGKDSQETYYYDCDQDLRIQQNDTCSKIWLKKGKIHDQQREEIEIPFDREQFDELKHLFDALGYGIQIQWYRTRNAFRWNDILVALDHTKGYGYIIEMEIMTSEVDKDTALEVLKKEFAKLKIDITSKNEFDKQYEYYKNNWRDLIK